MKARSRSHGPNDAPAKMRGGGKLANFLLLGFLAGLVTANFLPAANFNLASTLTIAGLLLSLLFSMLSHKWTARAEKKAADQTVRTLERRMERLIPQRHMKAHGMHSHGPHGREDCEQDRMPVARRSRALSRRR